MPNRDVILLETVRTHRARLRAAFVYGRLDERRLTNDNLRRVVGSVVMAAVVCAVCVGVAFVASLRAGQAATARQQAALGPATGPVVAADTFDRAVSAGWGSAELGGRWQLDGPGSAFAVRGGAASVEVGDSRIGAAVGPLTDRTDVTATLRRDPSRSAGTAVVGVEARRVSRTQDYEARVALAPDGSVSLLLARRAETGSIADEPDAALSNTVTLLGSAGRDGSGAGSDTEPPPAPVTVRVQAVGTNPTTLRAKAWATNGSEPQDWTVTSSDSTADLQRPGTVGLTAVGTGAGGTLQILDLVARSAP